MLRWWILDTFFKKELLDMQNYYQRKLEDIEINANKKTTMIEQLVHSILKEKNHVIVGEDINKMKEQVLVVQWVFDDDIWFMLFSERYKAINHPRIMASYVSCCEEEHYIEIDDILVVDDDVGNGSILMPYFIEYCKTTDAKYICGQLSSVDKGHFERLEHFYKKHGFNVKFTSNRSAGSIKYIIAEDTTESKK